MMLRTLVLVLPLSCLLTVRASCAPTISVDSATYTTTVQPGEEVVHVFMLTNTGNETLSISNVLASCGCTATSLEKTVLSPGESVGLETKVNTTGSQGTVDKRVTVRSNDPVTPDLFLHLMLTIAGVGQPASRPSLFCTASRHFLDAGGVSCRRASCRTPGLAHCGCRGRRRNGRLRTRPKFLRSRRLKLGWVGQ